MQTPVSRRAAVIATAISAIGVRGLTVRAQAADAADPYVTIRVYQLKDTADRAALIADTEASLLPLLETLPGWLGFTVLEPDPLTWFAITEWASKEDSATGGLAIKEWVAEHVADSIASGPESIEATVNITAAPASDATPAAS